MKFKKTQLPDAVLVELEPARDERGFFARTFCVDEFAAQGLETDYPQHSVSFSARRGTLRGMHFQRPPHAEVKLVRCLRGAVIDVIIDLRPKSPAYKKWQAFELTEANGHQLYIPKGFAHGFQTLCDDVAVHYLISERYSPASSTGVRFDDPEFAIDWPIAVSEISDKDRVWPDYADLLAVDL